MRKTILLCLCIILSINKVSAQVYKVEGTVYDTIYASIEQGDIRLRLVTTIYKDTLMRSETLMVPAYPVIRNQKIEVYQKGRLKRWHYLKIPKRYAYTTNGKWIRYQSIPVLGLSVQQDGERFFFMADGSEYGCGGVSEFLGIYSMQGETMSEGYGLDGAPIDKGWREKYRYPKPDTEIDYAFSSRCRLKEVTITHLIQP